MVDKHIQQAVQIALAEDLNGQHADEGDITANLIPQTHHIDAQVITREDCVLAGEAWVTETFRQINPDIALEWLANDGQALNANQTIVKISGNARQILTAERTALNFLQTLSAPSIKSSIALSLSSSLYLGLETIHSSKAALEFVVYKNPATIG